MQNEDPEGCVHPGGQNAVVADGVAVVLGVLVLEFVIVPVVLPVVVALTVGVEHIASVCPAGTGVPSAHRQVHLGTAELMGRPHSTAPQL